MTECYINGIFAASQHTVTLCVLTGKLLYNLLEVIFSKHNLEVFCLSNGAAIWVSVHSVCIICDNLLCGSKWIMQICIIDNMYVLKNLLCQNIIRQFRDGSIHHIFMFTLCIFSLLYACILNMQASLSFYVICYICTI